MYNYFYEVQEPLSHETLADALPGAIEPGSITFALVRQHVDQIVRVSEASIAAAIRWVISDQGWLAEGGGVVGIAALQSGKIALGDVTAVVISGGNVDASVVARVLAK
jgi:threonine dehydratase